MRSQHFIALTAFPSVNFFAPVAWATLARAARDAESAPSVSFLAATLRPLVFRSVRQLASHVAHDSWGDGGAASFLTIPGNVWKPLVSLTLRRHQRRRRCTSSFLLWRKRTSERGREATEKQQAESARSPRRPSRAIQLSDGQPADRGLPAVPRALFNHCTIADVDQCL